MEKIYSLLSNNTEESNYSNYPSTKKENNIPKKSFQKTQFQQYIGQEKKIYFFPNHPLQIHLSFNYTTLIKIPFTNFFQYGQQTRSPINQFKNSGSKGTKIILFMDFYIFLNHLIGKRNIHWHF